MNLARSKVLDLAKDIPEDKLTWAPLPGGNHALWVLGHLAWTDDYFVAFFSKKPSAISPDWPKRFGMGSTPTTDASAYPSLAQVKDSMCNARDRLIDWFKLMDEKQLLSPLPSDWTGFAPNFACMMNSIAWHEGLHAGQLSVCCRGLGIKPKM